MSESTKAVRGPNVDELVFAEAVWEVFKNKGTVGEVAERLGYKSAAAVSSRLANMRKAGVPVPKFTPGGGKGGGRKRNLKALQAIADKFSDAT
jgi:hypothetical protein